MTIIEINNSFPKIITDKTVNDFLKIKIEQLREKKILREDKKISLSVALVSKKEIAKLNQQYRKTADSTDVLSFCYDDNESKLVGEIILAPEVIKKYAQEDNNEVQSELRKNLVHGLLHILGFEHGKKMFLLQAELLELS